MYVLCCAVLLCRYKDAGGKSMETLEAVKHSKATLEAQLNSQRNLIDSMRQELGTAKVGCCQHWNIQAEAFQTKKPCASGGT